MLQVAPRAQAALHAPSHTDRQRRAISALFKRWKDEGQVREVTKALTLPYGQIVIFATGYMLAKGPFSACVGVDRDGSVSAL
jgi:hypothetical protein